MNSLTKRFCLAAVIAALYAAVSLALAPLAFGPIQIRIAEALTLLPILFPEAIVGVGIGCAITNAIGAMMGVNPLGFLDVFIGTFATVAAAWCSWKCRNVRIKNIPLLSIMMPVLFNTVIIGAELGYAFYPGAAFMSGALLMGLQVGLGEMISCFVLGIPLLKMLEKADLSKRFQL